MEEIEFIRDSPTKQRFKTKLRLAAQTPEQLQFDKGECAIKLKDSNYLYY